MGGRRHWWSRLRLFVALPLVVLTAGCGESPTGRLPPVSEPCCAAAATDWPAPRGPEGTGRVSDGPGLAEWSAGDLPVFARRDIGRGRSGIVVQGSRVVSSWAQEGYELVFCLDRRSGSMLWHVPLGEDDGRGSGPLATPILTAAGHVIAVGSAGVVVAIDIVRGRELWRKDLSRRVRIGGVAGGYGATPLVERGLVVLAGSNRHALVALDARDGSLVWVAETGGSASVSPVRVTVGDRVDLVTSVAAGLVGVDPESGRRRWLRTWQADEGAALSRPYALGDGRILIGEPGSLTLLRLSASPAEAEVHEVWSAASSGALAAAVPVRIPGAALGSPGSGAVSTAADGLVLLEGDRLVLRDAESGEVRSSLEAPSPGWPIASGNHVLLVAADGRLRRFDVGPDGLEGGEERVPLPATTGSPALSDGELFLRDDSSLVGIALPVVAGVDADEASVRETVAGGSESG